MRIPSFPALNPAFAMAALLACAAQALELTPPAGWTAPARAVPGALLVYSEPANPALKGQSAFQNNVVATRGKLPCCGESGPGLDSLLSRMAFQQARQLPLYRLLEKAPRAIAGRRGGVLVSTYSRGELDLAVVQYVYVQGKEFVSIVFTCPAAELAVMRPRFEASVRTLKADPA